MGAQQIGLHIVPLITLRMVQGVRDAASESLFPGASNDKLLF